MTRALLPLFVVVRASAASRLRLPLAAALAVVAAAAGCPSELAAPGCKGAACDVDDEPQEPPRLFVDPPFGLGFDCVTIGCDAERSLVVENRGGGIVRLRLVRLAVDSSTDFRLRRADDGPLPFDASTTVDVLPGSPLELVARYAPTDGVLDTGTVQIDWYDGAKNFDDAVVQNVELPLSTRALGSAAAAIVDPRLDFGFVPVGGFASREIVVANNGDGGVLTVGPVTLEDGTPATFVEPVAGDWGERFVNPGEQARIPVKFRPDTDGAFLGALLVQTSDGANPALRVEVAGTSLGEPRIALSTPSPLSLDVLRVQQTRAVDVVVTNLGGADLVVQGGIGFGDGLSLTPAEPQTITALASTTFSLAWTPTRGGDFTGQLAFGTNDPTQRLVAVDVTGFVTAPLLSASPAAVDLGDVVQGWLTDGRTIELSNTGFGDLTINAITFDVGSSQQIQLVDVPALPMKLAPGEPPVAITVTMTAGTLGPQDAVILVGSDSVDGPLGLGGTARLSVHGDVITCDQGCPVPNGTPSCDSGSCAIAGCSDRFHDADQSFGNGCECGEDNIGGGARRDLLGTCPGTDIGPLGDDCASVREVRRSGNTLHDERDVDLYFFRATDESEFFGCDFGGDSFGVRLGLENAPAGMRLCAVQRASGTGCGGDNQRRCVSAGSELFFGGGNQVFGGSDTSDFTVWVEWPVDAAPQCGSYTLFVKGNAG